MATLHQTILFVPFSNIFSILYLCHILLILRIFQIVHYYYFILGDLWLVMLDVTVVILGVGGCGPYRAVNLIENSFACQLHWQAIPLSLSLFSDLY